MTSRGSLWMGAITPQIVPPDPVMRAVDTAVMIAEKPAVVVIERKDPGANTTSRLPEQTVRLEVIQNIRESNEMRDAWVNVNKQYIVIVGIRDHPSIPNTDLQRADLFFYLGRLWEVTELIDNVPGRLLANANLQT